MSPADAPPLVHALRTLTVSERRLFVSGLEVLDPEMIIARIKRPYVYPAKRGKALKKKVGM